jgi:hypothetical protein
VQELIHARCYWRHKIKENASDEFPTILNFELSHTNWDSYDGFIRIILDLFVLEDNLLYFVNGSVQASDIYLFLSKLQ